MEGSITVRFDGATHSHNTPQFVPVATQVLKAALQNAARETAQNVVRHHIHGFHKEELIELLQKKFREAGLPSRFFPCDTGEAQKELKGGRRVGC